LLRNSSRKNFNKRKLSSKPKRKVKLRATRNIKMIKKHLFSRRNRRLLLRRLVLKFLPKSKPKKLPKLKRTLRIKNCRKLKPRRRLPKFWPKLKSLMKRNGRRSTLPKKRQNMKNRLPRRRRSKKLLLLPKPKNWRTRRLKRTLRRNKRLIPSDNRRIKKIRNINSL